MSVKLFKDQIKFNQKAQQEHEQNLALDVDRKVAAAITKQVVDKKVALPFAIQVEVANADIDWNPKRFNKYWAKPRGIYIASVTSAFFANTICLRVNKRKWWKLW